jgi:hypothetical protein
MTMMSVYQANTPVRQLDQLECIGAAGTREDTQLIRLSLRTHHPVLVGLDGAHAIVKPVGEGDERHSFEALFDTCYTFMHLQKMQDAGVDKPEDIPLDSFRVIVGIPVGLTAAVHLAIAASSIGDTRPRLRTLFNEDVMFREALFQQVMMIVAAWLVGNAEEIDVAIRDTTNSNYEPIEPPLDTKAGHMWRILED